MHTGNFNGPIAFAVAAALSIATISPCLGQASQAAAANTLTAAKEASAATGRPIFAVAGRST